jgi:hypothetical protein
LIEIDWSQWNPPKVTPLREDAVEARRAAHAGQLYAARWDDFPDGWRVWRCDAEVDVVLAGWFDGEEFSRVDRGQMMLRYDHAVLIQDVEDPWPAPPEVVFETDDEARVAAPLPALTAAPAPPGPFVDAPRAALEREAADADGVPTCVGCGARGRTGRSRRCASCWARSRGGAVPVAPAAFVAEIDDFDLLPDA